MNTGEAMESVEAKKFLFDNDFTKVEMTPPAPEEEPSDENGENENDGQATDVEEEIIEEVIIPTFSEEEVQKAREEGVQTGRDEALKDLEGSLQKKLSDTMTTMEQRLAEILDQQIEQKDERTRNAAAVASVIVRKIFPSLNMEKAMDEINHMIEQALSKTSGKTKMMFYVADEIKNDVESKITDISALSGREIEVKVIGNPDTKLGDCRIEWSGGGLVRDQNQMWREIDEIIERNLGGMPTIGPEESGGSVTDNETVETVESVETAENNDSADTHDNEVSEEISEAPSEVVEETTGETPEETDGTTEDENNPL